MNDKIRFTPKLSISDKIVEALGIILLVLFWAFTIANYSNLPDTIVTHYNGAGEPDGYGDKWLILTLPLVATVLFVGLTIVGKFPHIFNYPTEITPENARAQYKIATQFLRYMKTAIVFIFGMIAYRTIENAPDESEGLGSWFLPMVLVLVFAPIFVFLIKSSRSS